MGSLPMARTPRLLRGWLALLCASSLLTSGPALRAQEAAKPAPQEPSAEERAASLRAMIVLKMAPYLAPETPPKQSPKIYRLVVVGTDAVTEVVRKQMAGKRLEERTIEVVAVTPADAATGKGTADADLMYLASTVDEATVKKVLEVHADKPLPTVCERPGFAAQGGGIQLFVQDNLIRFEANADALKKQGMRASPQLLKLSRKGPR